jgi:flagellar motor component MotA
MKLRWVCLLAANFANSLYMAFILVSMYLNAPHALTLVEPNELIITIEAIVSTIIVISSIVAIGWNLIRRQ